MSVQSTLANALATVNQSTNPVAYQNLTAALNKTTADMGMQQVSAAADLTYQRNVAQAQATRDWQEIQNAKAMTFSATEAEKNRNWQEYMSNTAHQREVQDLLAAGLNPILSATGGNGAAVTSGATASGVTSSGATASGETGLTNAFSSLFNTLLNVTTSLANANTSAITNLAVADKYNEMSKYTAELSAATAIKNAETAASASRYGADIQKYIAGNYPNSMWAVLDRYLGAVLDGDSTPSKLNAMSDQAREVFNDFIAQRIKNAGNRNE